MNLVEEIIVLGGHARSFEAKKGQLVKVTDLEGQQVADFMAFSKDNLKEKLSPSHSYLSALSLKIEPGYILRTNLRTPIFLVKEATSESHDLLMPACDEQRYRVDYGLEGYHRNCIDNFEEVFAPYGLNRENFSNPFNIFQKTSITPDGRMIQETGDSKAGDYLLMECLMDVVGAVSACPMDVNAIAGSKITDIKIQIYEA